MNPNYTIKEISNIALLSVNDCILYKDIVYEILQIKFSSINVDSIIKDNNIKNKLIIFLLIDWFG